jgi:hypothetical protein
MGSGGGLPVGRSSPARGVHVDRVGNAVTITGVLEMYGAEASGARVQSVESSINKIWTATFPNGVSITCKIQVKFRGAGSVPGNVTQIEAVQQDGPSAWHKGGSNGGYISLNPRNPDAFGWTAAHEFGHLLGLDDRYDESFFSAIRGQFGGQRVTTAKRGYAGNLMADVGGSMSSFNITDVIDTNEPSPYWINDDDYVASWMNTHPRTDVAKLSTATKLRAFNTLLSGSVSVDDLNAMTRICASVSTSNEASAVRKSIDPLRLTDLGQRTTLRLAMAKMP